jgi:regulator of protease activity HflC (stomatin/prohibitin superfamily)
VNRAIITGIVLLILIVIGLVTSLFTVDEKEQAIVTQLGKYVRTITEPGLQFKVPFLQSVHRFEDRVLEYDADAAKIITSDKKDSVYARMRAERQRQAKKYRSEGEEEAVKIRAATDKEKTILLAESYRQAEKLKGEGDAEALKIYAEAFEKDPEFYSFIRTLEAYEKSLRRDTTVVLPSDSEFFRYLSGSEK